MRTIAKTAGHPFDLLDFSIDAFCQSIGDAMTCISYNVVKMGLERLSRLFYRLKPAVGCPKIPAFKIFAHVRFVAVDPHVPQVLLNCPGTTYFQVFSFKRIKLLLAPVRNILLKNALCGNRPKKARPVLILKTPITGNARMGMNIFRTKLIFVWTILI